MRLIAVGSVALALGLALVACSDDETNGSPDGTPDGGALSFEGGSGFDASTSTPVDGGADASPDASPDVDAGADAGPELNALFAHIGATLYEVDPETGALRLVGTTGEDTMTIAWDANAKVARVVIGQYSPTGAGALTPKLGTIDLCTAVVTPGPNITLGANQVRRAESLAQNPTTGVLHISYGTSGTGSSTEFTTEATGTIDPTTGAITAVGKHSTYQTDGDSMMFVGPTLHLLDVATNVSKGALYTIDAAGAATKLVETGPDVRRVTYDPTRQRVYATDGTGSAPSTSRRIVTLDLADGSVTPLATQIAADAQAGTHFTTIVSLPRPTCL